MRSLETRRLILVALLFTIIVGLVSQTGNSFELGEHDSITRQALPFLNAQILNIIVNANIAVDQGVTLLASQWHFDNCRFRESTENINNQYGNVLGFLNPDNQPNDNAATVGFGRLLHPVQDFYAHSNWVDMGRGDLIDAGLGIWTVLTPWSNVRSDVDVIVIQGEKPPAGWTLTRDGRIVTVTTPTGKFRGLISGTFGLADDCPDNIAMSHDLLNKDGAQRLNFQPARDLAIRQTVHEWCRLENLVLSRYGQNGLDRLRRVWIRPGAASPCVSVPTLTEWGLIALGLLLAGSLAFMIRRRVSPRPTGA